MAKLTKKWSYSRYSMYAKCPAQYEWHYILKNPRSKSPALDRGIAIHKKGENFVNGIITGLPNELKNFSKEFKNLKKEYMAGNGFTEPDISVDSEGNASSKFETDYFIGFADFAHFGKEELTVIDYKTGKRYSEHRDQGHVYSAFLLHLNPDYEKINVEFWYLDDPCSDTNVMDFSYKQSDKDSMLSLWERRVDKMYSDKKFLKTPNKFCNWCAKKKAGKCNGK